jgi:c-di-GMP-binding flagellar brake protein YcgR
MPLASEVTLAIGQRLEIGVRDHWWPTRLEDRTADDQVTVAWPLSSLRRPLYLEVGEAVELGTVVHDDGAYAATGQVVALEKGNVPLVTVRLVGEWQRSQRRNAVRVPVAIRPRIAEVVYSDMARRTVRLGVTDISATGVHLRSKDEIHAGDLLHLAFELDQVEVNVQARVRRVECNERVWDAGCSFEGISESEAQRIVRFIFAQQRALLRVKRGS